MLGNQLLTGEKVYLSAVRREHLPQFVEWFQDLEFQAYLQSRNVFPLTMQDEEAWYDGMLQNENARTFGLFVKEDNRLIGSAGFPSIDWRNRDAVFGIAIGDRNSWGKGFGTDATRLVVAFGFLELNMHRITLQVHAYNTRGIRAYEKVGFKVEVTRRAAMFRDGTYHDLLTMGLLRSEWEQQ